MPPTATELLANGNQQRLFRVVGHLPWQVSDKPQGSKSRGFAASLSAPKGRHLKTAGWLHEGSTYNVYARIGDWKECPLKQRSYPK
ncbi:MAG: hypothetical protein QGG28_06050, partial [Alphaproteobacteria bacterium]|nr:hypothetical protein [Alphaproteobacteria bacterium]